MKFKIFLLCIFSFCTLQSWAQKAQLDSILSYLRQVNIYKQEVVLKQAVLESGWMKSKFFKNTKNLFGFKGAKGYLKFSSWKESVDYYKNWQLKHYRDTSENYYAFLKRIRYARSKEYIRLLKGVRLARHLSADAFKPIFYLSEQNAKKED